MNSREVLGRIWRSAIGHGEVRNTDYLDRPAVKVMLIPTTVLLELRALRIIPGASWPEILVETHLE